MKFSWRHPTKPVSLLILLASIYIFLSGVVFAQTSGTMTYISWSPDGSRIASAYNDGSIRIWDATTNQVLLELQTDKSRGVTITWSPDSTRLASASGESGLIRIWDTTNGQQITEFQGHSTSVGLEFVAWNPNGTMLVSIASTVDGTYPLQFWSASNDIYQSLAMSAGVSAFDIAWSPDGTRLAVADTGGVYIFDDLSAVNLVHRTIAPFALSALWSPDGTKIAIFKTDGAIQILDPNTAQVLLALQWVPNTAPNGIASITWSPDGSMLASDNFSGDTQFWDATTGQLIQTLSQSRQGRPWLMTWSPDGTKLAYGGTGTTVQIIPAPTPTPSGTCDITVPAADVLGLVSAIQAANANPDATTVCLISSIFSLTAVDNTTLGSNGLPAITSPLTLRGLDTGAVINRDSAAPAFRLFHVQAAGRLTLDNVSLSGGDNPLHNVT